MHQYEGQGQSFPAGSEVDVVGSDINSSRRLVPEYTMNPRNDGSFLVIDKTQKDFVITLWIGLVLTFILGFAIVGLMPNANLIITQSSDPCENPYKVDHDKHIKCQDFDISSNPTRGIMLKDLSKYNQHIILNAYFYFNDTTNNTLVRSKISIQQYKLNYHGGVESEISEKKFQLNLDNYTLRNNFFSNQSKMIGVKGQLMYQHNIKVANRLVIVEFQDHNDKHNLKDISIEVVVINPDFTSYSKNIRIVFFVFSIVTLMLYNCRTKAILSSRRVIEHKLISHLTVLLIIFNNPFIAVLHSNNRFLIFILQLSFLLLPVGLIFFWMCVFERGEIENTRQISSAQGNIYTWILVILIFIFQFTMYLVKAYNHLVDYVGPETESSSFVGLRYVCFFLILFGYIRIAYRIINVFMKQDSLARYRRLISLSLLVIVFSLLFFFTVQYSIYSTESKAIYLMVFFFNIYIYYLQALYAKSTFENQTFLPPVSEHMLQIPQPFTIHDIPRKVEENPIPILERIPPQPPQVEMDRLERVKEEVKQEDNLEGQFVIEEEQEKKEQIREEVMNDEVGEIETEEKAPEPDEEG